MSKIGKAPAYRKRSEGISIMLAMVVVIVSCAGVFAGYLGTKYVMLPLMNSINQGSDSAEKQPDSSGSNKSGQIQKEGEAPPAAPPNDATQNQASLHEITFYTLQFGMFSAEENAKIASQELEDQYIFAYPVKNGDQYKLLSLPFLDKEKARTFATGYQTMGADCFITERKVQISNTYGETFVRQFSENIYLISAGAYTGPERIQMVLESLDKMKLDVTEQDGAEAKMIDAFSGEITNMNGSDNQILFELQKKIIMNLETMLIK